MTTVNDKSIVVLVTAALWSTASLAGTLKAPVPAKSEVSSQTFDSDSFLSDWNGIRKKTKKATVASFKGPDLPSEDLLRETLTADSSALTSLQAKWSPLGMTLNAKTTPRGANDVVWILAEAPGKEERRGVYLIRKSPGNGISLEFPHGDSDQFTGEIGAHLCLEEAFDTCSWNTASRKSIDLAHTDGTLWQAMLKAQATLRPATLVVQLHGFESTKRRSREGRGADVIFSTGSRDNHACIEPGLPVLAKAIPGLVTRLYGKDIFELGATTNSQAALIRDLGGYFVHIEMKRQLRKRLAKSQEARKGLYEAIDAIKEDYIRRLAKNEKKSGSVPKVCM